MLIVITGPADNQVIRERALAHSDWDNTVKAVAAGEWTYIAAVIHTATGNDITDLIAEEVARVWHDHDEKLEDWQKDFLKEHLRVRRLQAAE